MMPAGTQCWRCKHYIGGKPVGFGLTCKAFPEGIPDTIFHERHDHRKVYPGDDGILFEPKAKRGN